MSDSEITESPRARGWRPFVRRLGAGRSPVYVRLLVLVAFMVAVAVLIQVSGLREDLSLEAMRRALRANPWSGVALFIVFFSIGNLVRVPGLVFFVAAVLALGLEWGGLLSYVGGVAASCVVFAVIRMVGGDGLLRDLRWRWADALLARVDARPVTTVAVLRMVLMTLPGLNYALAMSGLRFRHYFLGTVLGLPLPTVVCCLFFDSVMRFLGVSA